MGIKSTLLAGLFLLLGAGALQAQNTKVTLRMTRGWAKYMGGDQSWPPDPTWKTQASFSDGISATGEICRYLDNFCVPWSSGHCNSGLAMFSSFNGISCCPREWLYDDVFVTYDAIPSSGFNLNNGFKVTINLRAWEDDKGGICDYNSGDDEYGSKDSTFWVRLPNNATFPYHMDFTIETDNKSFRVSYRLTVESLDAISNTSLRIANSSGVTQSTFCTGDPVRLYADRRSGFSNGRFEWQRRNTPSSAWVSATSTTYTSSNFLEVSAVSPMPDYRVRLANNASSGTASSDGWIMVSGSAITVGPAPPPMSSITTSISGACSGSSNGAIQVNVSGTSTTAQYLLTLVTLDDQPVASFSPPMGSSITHTFTGLAAGSYRVKVGFSGGVVNCTTVSNVITVSTLSLPVISAAGAAANCAGQDGRVTINITQHAAGMHTFQLLNAAGNTVLLTFNSTQTSHAFQAAAGTYRARVINGNGCSSALSAQVVVPNPPAAVTALANPVSVGGGFHIRCLGGDGTIQITPSGGTPPYQVSVTGLPPVLNVGAFQQVAFTRPAGIHAYAVIDNKGCSVNGTVQLIQPSQALGLNISNIQPTSDCEPPIGAATLAGAGGAGSYQYSVDNPNGPFTTNGQMSGLSAGSHTAYVRDLTGCAFSSTFTIGAPNPLLAEVVSVSQALCAGSANGSVTLSASGGNPPYLFRIGNGAFTTQTTYSGLAADTYTFQVRDADNCTHTVMQNVAAPNAINITSHTISDLDCDGATRNFTIAFTGRADGIPNYFDNNLEISTDNGANFAPFYESYDDGHTVQVEFFGMPVGDYPVIIRDANNCTSNTYTVNVASGPNLSAALEGVTHETCAGANDGTITVSFSGGVAPYFLRLIRPISSDEYEEIATFGPVTTPGTHTFTGVPVINGGVGYFVWVLDRYLETWDWRCSISIPSHSGPYLPGQGIIINPNAPFNSGTAQISGPLLNCYGNNGQVTIVGTSGGTAPYVYSQDGEVFQSSNVFSGLGANNNFYVRDSRGCKQGPVSVTIPFAPVTLNATATLTDSETACTKGAIQVNISGGTGPFEVALIQGGDCAQAYTYAETFTATSIPFSGLSAGNYTVCIRDAGGCRADRSIAVPLVAQPNMAITATQNTTCLGGSNSGSISLQATGGTPPYTITINNGSPQTGGASTTFTFGGLAAGGYLFQLTDAKGCTDLLVGNVPSNNLLSASVDADPISGCAGGNTGALKVVPSNGVAPYSITWLWDNATVNGVGEGQEILRSGLPAGVYQVRITDQLGCQLIETEIVDTPLPLSATLLTVDALCANVPNGSVTIQASGGWQVYEYALNGSSFQSSPTFTNLAPGNYTATVRDTSNCSANFPFTIGVQRTLTANATPTNPTCFGQTNGTIAIAVSGGGLPYSFSLNNGPFQPDNPITGLGQGTYQVLIRDNGGCEISLSNIMLTEPPQLSASVQVLQDASCANNAGNLLASASGGTPGYSYLWNGNPALNTAAYSNAPPGMHTVVITDSRGCMATASANISNVPSVSLNVVSTTNDFCNQSNGTATVSPQGGMPPFNFSWSHNTALNSPVAIGLSAGPYTVTVTDGNNCVAIRNLTIGATVTVSLTLVEALNSFCQQGTGRITVAPTGAFTPPLTYAWSHNTALNSPSATNLASGSYTVTVTDGNNCINTLTTTIALVLGPSATAATQPASCQGNTGSVQVQVSGGTAPFQYAWSHNAGLNSNIAAGLTSGSYSCTVTDFNGCTAIATATVGELPPPQVVVNTTTATCALPNGSAQATTTGGTTPFTYQWSSGNPSNAVAQNLPEGNYTLTVTDAFGCQVIAAFSIGNIPGPSALQVAFQHSACTDFNGSISVSPQGGTNPFSYQWSHNAFLQQPVANLLAAGTYSVTATDANGCTASATQIILLQGPPAIQTIQQQNSLCVNGAGLIEVLATGTGPFSYAWTGNVSTGALAQNLSAGSYTVTVTDANGCQNTRQYTISLEPAPFIQLIQLTHDVCGQGRGAIRIRAVGGRSPIVYAWSHNPSLNTDWPTGLTAGVYAVTITDANGCSATAQYVLTETPGPNLEVTNISLAFCSNPVGAVTVQAFNGTPPFSYAWSHNTNLNSSVAQNLPPGTYQATVTDQNGCTATAQADVEATQAPVLFVISTGDDPCAVQDASIVMGIDGSAPPFTYAWSHNASLNSLSANGLASGTYTLTATDAHGCQTSLSATVADRQGPTLQILNVTPSTCGFADGSAAVGASLGQAPYTFSWSHSAAVTGSFASGLAAGTYTVTVTDANQCTAVVGFNVSDSQGPQLAITQAADAICTPNSGSISVTATGGLSPYAYSWSHNATLNAPTATGLSAGSYSITTTDANGCLAVTTGSIGFQGPPTASAAVIHAVCQPNTGSIAVSASNGQAPYSIAWNVPALGGFQPSPVFAGQYSATITDGNGCITVLPVTVDFIPGPTLLLVQKTDATCGQANGALQVGEVGGQLPYHYAWSHDPLLNFFLADGLAAGQYTVTVTDGNSCTATLSETIVNRSGPTLVFVSTNSACGQSNGSATISATGGTPPLSYTWSHDSSLNSTSAGGLAAGMYSVTATDANGCSAVAQGAVSDADAPTLTVSNFAHALCLPNSGSINLSASGGQAPYTYAWSHNANLQSAQATGLAAGNYSATVTDANGCRAFISQVLTFIPGPNLDLQTSTPSICQDGAGALHFAVQGGAAPYLYAWSHNAALNSPAASGLTAGAYTLSVSDANGCSTSATASVALAVGPQLSIAQLANSYCGNSAGAIQVNATGGAVPLQYFWSHQPGLNAPLASALPPGTYSLTVTDANGCADILSAVVGDTPGFDLSSPVVQAAACGQSTGQIILTTVGGQAPFQYQWSHDAGLNGPLAAGLAVGVYTATVTDASGCTRHISVPLSNQGGPALSIMQAQNATCGQNNGSIVTQTSGGQPPYSYAWNNGLNGSAAFNLAGGAYQITVTDAAGCQGVAVVALQSSSAPVLQLLNSNDAQCAFATGSLLFGASGGQLPYNYSWSHQTGLNSAQATGLPQGHYTLTITDAAGCVATASATVQADTDLGLILLQNQAATCTAANGSATVAGIQGQAPYTYAWSHNAAITGPTALNLPPGTHMATVTDAEGCIATLTVQTISENVPLVLSLGQITPSACHSPTGVVQVVPNSGTPPYTFAWNHNATLNAAMATGLAAGSYTVTATDVNGCTGMLQATVGQTPAPQLSLLMAEETDCGQATGSLQVSAGGGQPPYAFTWSHNAALNAATATGLAAGSYTVTATDVNGCAATLSASVSESNAPNISASFTASWCGQATGTAIVPEPGNFTYAWANTAAPGIIISTTAQATGLAQGTYSVTVANAQGCSTVRVVQVTDLPDMVLSASATPVTCFGQSNGSIAVTVGSGGTAPFSFLWSNNVSGSTQSGLPAGTYQATVTDANGCTALTAVSVAQPTALSVGLGSATPPLCPSSTNGAIAVQVGGGTSPYAYQWATGQQTPAISGLGAGLYQLTTTDANGCQAVFQRELLATGSLNIQVNTIAPLCAGLATGTATANVTGVPGPYTYQWSVPGNPTGNSVSNLSPGSYAVTVSNAAGCSASQSFQVAAAPAINLHVSSTPSCLNTLNGTASALATGGAGGFSYLWNTLAQVPDLTGLLPGLYSVTATDVNGCTASQSIIVEGAPFPVLTIVEILQPNCVGQTAGTAQVLATGGTGSIQYRWSDAQAQISATAVNLPPGIYSVTATDQNGCTSTETIEITPPATFSTSVVSVARPACFGEGNGSAVVAASGGSGSFSYQWNDPLAQIGNTAFNLAAGSYFVTITDNASGCFRVQEVVVANPPLLTLATVSTTPARCAGQNNGAATVAANGGTGAYSFAWNDPAGQISAEATGLAAASYWVTVTDARGCTASTQVSITQPQPLVAQITTVNAPLCFGQNNGDASVTVNGGTPPYSYLWNDPALQSTAAAQGLASGSYTVVVRDANNCLTTAGTFVPFAPAISLTAVQQINPTCAGLDNGRLEVLASGGTGALSYQWSNGGNSPAISGLAAGNYMVTVRDANNCQQTLTLALTAPAALSLASAQVIPVTCYTGADGSISISIQGGTGSYTYRWSDPAAQTSATATGLMRGDYAVTATDFNGCTLTADFSVNSIGLQIFVNAVVSNTSCRGATNAVIALSASGGAGGFGFQWANGQTGAVLSNVSAGVYAATVTDSQGCQQSVLTTVNDGAAFQVDIGPRDTILCEGEALFVDFSRSDYTVLWTSQNGFSSQNRLTALRNTDTYYLQVTNAQGCIAHDTIRVTVINEALQAFFVIPTDVVLGQEVVALEGSWPIPSQVYWHFPPDSVQLLRRQGDQYFFRFTQTGQVRLRMQSILGNCQDWIEKVITVHADSSTIPGLNPDEPDILGIMLAPNPNSGQFALQVLLSGPKDLILTVYDLNGVVQERRIRQGLSTYNESYNLNVQPGTYFLMVQSPKQRRTLAFSVIRP